MTTSLRAAARQLGLKRRMMGEGSVRTAIVLGAALDEAIATRLSNVLDPPIELYLLEGEELRPL